MVAMSETVIDVANNFGALAEQERRIEGRAVSNFHHHAVILLFAPEILIAVVP
jgi:hypothetical protein